MRPEDLVALGLESNAGKQLDKGWKDIHQI